MDPCENCPLYWCTRDYWGEYDEDCMCHLEGWFDGKDYKIICYMPSFIKKIYKKYVLWKEERYWSKHVKKYEEELEE